MCVNRDEIDVKQVENQIKNLWDLLDKNMTIIDKLGVMYAKIGWHENGKSSSRETDSIETDVLQATEKAEGNSSRCYLRIRRLSTPVRGNKNNLRDKLRGKKTSIACLHAPKVVMFRVLKNLQIL